MKAVSTVGLSSGRVGSKFHNCSSLGMRIILPTCQYCHGCADVGCTQATFSLFAFPGSSMDWMHGYPYMCQVRHMGIIHHTRDSAFYLHTQGQQDAVAATSLLAVCIVNEALRIGFMLYMVYDPVTRWPALSGSARMCSSTSWKVQDDPR